MENKEKKKMSPKISRRLIIIGAIAIVIGLLLIGLGVGKIHDYQIEYENAEAQYERDYADWKDRWYENPQTAGARPKRPDQPVSVAGIGLCVGGGFLIFIGITITLTGLTPYIVKFGAKMEKETLDYAGDDISAAGVRGIGVAEPIINKGTDVIAPNMEKIARSIKSGVSTTKSSKGKHCTECGAEMGESEAFCSKCGTKHANVCECGHTNDANDKFCGKCGKPLK